MRTRIFEKKMIVFFGIMIVILCICCYVVNKYLLKYVVTVSTNSGNNGEIIIETNKPEKFQTDDGFEYYTLLKDNETIVSITKYVGKEKQLIIPEKINGNKVLLIGDSAFCYCDKIESIEIPEGVSSVGVCAFGGCKKLKTVMIYGEATELKYNCFVDCSDELKIYCKNNSAAEKYAKENSLDYKTIE